MKFFQLSDLHIGKQLHHYSLLEEQRELLQQVVWHVRKEEPDVLLIAGDIYDTSVPSSEAIGVFDQFLSELDALEQKLTVCVIAGNHDSGRRLDYASRILKKHAIHIVGMPPVKPEEFICTVTLEDAFGEVIFYLLPFVKPAFVKKIFPEETLSYSDAVKRLLEREVIDETKRNILVSHQFYAGRQEIPSVSESEVHIAGGIDSVEINVLKPFDYAALGHIHRAQRIGEEKNWYCGTIFPYSVSEGEDEKFITMVELNEKGVPPIKKKLSLQQTRRVRKLRGTLEEVMGVEENICYDYASITLTDEVEICQPRERLEEKYKHILEIKIDNARTRKLLELGDIEVEKLTPYEAFCDFFYELNGRTMTEEEDILLKEILQEGGDIE